MQLLAMSGWRRACQHVKGWLSYGGGVALPIQEVGCVGVWWNCTDVIVSVLMLCCDNDNNCGLSVGFQWPVKFSLRIGVREDIVLAGFWSM